MKMDKIFIDCGANDCHQQYDIDYIKGFKIIAFEPNPKFKNSFDGRPDIVFYPYAVWIKNSKLDFYVEETSIGCSLLPSKIEKDSGMTQQQKDKSLNNPIKVESIDLAEYITSTYNKEDLIIIRMDIEGAEYEVIKHLINTKCIDYINELWVEFHDEKVSVTDPIKQEIKKYFNKNNDITLKNENGN